MSKSILLLGLALLLAPGVEAGKGPILLVDDDGSDGGYADVRTFYTDALDGSGFWGQYDLWEVPYSSDGPTAVDMAPYGAVIWFTGEIYGQGSTVTLTQNDETSLATYLDGGGKLFLSSAVPTNIL